MVADRHALRAADIDGVLSRPRFPLINQIHQRLRRRHQIKVMAGPASPSSAMSGACHVSGPSHTGRAPPRHPADRLAGLFLTKAFNPA
jgi:hypothetical protein